MSPNPMAGLTDKGGARFGSGGFQRKSPAEAGIGGVPNHSELELRGGVPYRLGGASEDGGVRRGLASAVASTMAEPSQVEFGSSCVGHAARRSCFGFAASKPRGDGHGAGAVQSLAR